MRLEDRVCSAWWAVEQGLCYGCMLTLLLSNITFAAVIKSVTYTRFKVDKDIMDALVHLMTKRGWGGRRKVTIGEPVLAMLL